MPTICLDSLPRARVAFSATRSFEFRAPRNPRSIPASALSRTRKVDESDVRARREGERERESERKTRKLSRVHESRAHGVHGYSRQKYRMAERRISLEESARIHPRVRMVYLPRAMYRQRLLIADDRSRSFTIRDLRGKI